MRRVYISLDRCQLPSTNILFIYRRVVCWNTEHEEQNRNILKIAIELKNITRSPRHILFLALSLLS